MTIIDSDALFSEVCSPRFLDQTSINILKGSSARDELIIMTIAVKVALFHGKEQLIVS
jgi:hypothetical protein